MKDELKTKEQLINELVEMRQRIAELEVTETERKRAEEELYRLNEELLAEKGKLEDIVKGIGAGLSLLDSETRVVWANEILQGWFGPIEKIGSRPCYELYELEDPQEECGALCTLRSGQIEHGDAFAYNIQGERKYFQLTTVPLKGEDGRIVQIVELTQDITERKRAEEALQRRAAQLELLNDVGGRIAAILELDSVLDWAARLMQERFGYHHVGLFTLDRERGELMMRARVGAFTHLFPPEHRLELGQGMVGWVGRHGQSLLANDVQAEPRYVNLYPDQVPTQSELSVPIRVGGQVVGVLDVQSPQLNAFDENDALVIETLADQVAVAIENARLYEQARQDAETKATLLQEVNHRVKNNLTAITGLLYAERRRDGMDDHLAYQSLLDDLTSRVQGLARVHDMLSAAEWAPLPLDELTRQIIQGALQMLPHDKRISVDVTPSPVRVTPQQANSLALVINELATNTVKYALAKRPKAHISVRIALEEDTVLFEFRDDGPGYPEEVLRLERHSVGSYLIQTMVRDDLGGELSLHNDHGAVTTVRFKKDPSGF
jgi:PAS domain S-box-containing protein